MKNTFGKYLVSDPEKGNGEWRFVGTRIPVRLVLLQHVAIGESFEECSRQYRHQFPPEAVELFSQIEDAEVNQSRCRRTR
jgi:uncharacterized protein (DUF433 family)